MRVVTATGFLFLIGCIHAFGQSDYYKFSHLDANQGLSHNQVTCFLKDKKGFLWIGTASGLNRYDGYSVKVFRNDSRDSSSLSYDEIAKLFELPGGKIGVVTVMGINLYDPETERFQRNLTSYYNQFGIPPGAISDAVKDRSGNFWIIHATAGLIYYDVQKRRSLIIRHSEQDASSVASDSVSAFTQDRNGNNWIVHASGILEKIVVDDTVCKVVYRTRVVLKKEKFVLMYHMLADADGDLWIHVTNDNDGVFYFDTHAKTFKHFGQDSPTGRLTTNLISDVKQDDKGLLWIGTDHGGINIVNKKDFSVVHIFHDDQDDKSLAQNSVSSMYRDDEGIIWIGTFKHGVNYYHENIIRFPLVRHVPLDTKGLPYNDLNRFVEDEKGNLWIGTNGGGLLYYDRHAQTFKQYKHDPRNPESLSADVIVSLCIDHEKKLWIGTYYGGLDSFDGKKFTHYRHRADQPGSLSGQSAWEIFEDSHGNLWVGTLNEGLNLFDRNTRTFTHYRTGEANSIQSNYVAVLLEDREGNLWIGTSEGVDVLLRETHRFVHYAPQANDPASLSNKGILDIKEDSKGRIWIATHAGLNLFNKQTKNFRVFKESDGLPHGTIVAILEDNNGNLWLSTPNGLSNMILDYNVVNVKFRNYDEADGLQGRQFNENAAYKTSRGELIFGGANGFNIFKPEQLGLNLNVPQVVLSDFQLLNRSVAIGEEIDGRVILTKAISETTQTVLPPSNNSFSIEFSALNYFHPEKNEYKYKLEGFNNDWLTVDGNSRKVTFTNLDPGEYVFRVKAANNDGFWNEEGTSLHITILSPFWKTRTAYFLYALAGLGVLLASRKFVQQREQMKFAIRQERQEALRMHELDMMKIKFFTNVSHEFRTPLTLILTPLEKMIRQSKDGDQQNQFQLIQRNAKRLLNLVNQLLDFRKLEVEEIRYNPSEGDIISFIRETVFSFSDLSEKENIKLDFYASVSSLETLFDQDKLEKILFNLLSNAFKFTPEQGKVTVNVSVLAGGSEKVLRIEVKDTGIGIPEDKKEKVFERFFQNELPRSMVNQGSGIGLSITKEFVKIHGGTITVESEVGKGSTFTVSIPIQEVLNIPANGSGAETILSTATEDGVWNNADAGSKKAMLLLVEDNEDFRFYLKDNLKSEYQIVEAKNGVEGWKLALGILPDLIVTDVMMPEMNGIEFCRKIKADQRTSHIPVILLTARSSEEQKLEGFETGADEYITKPFNFEILVSRMKNLIEQRKKYHNAFQTRLEVKASDLNITSLDEKFIQNAVKFVEQNVTDADFSVDDLSRELGISRAYIYKKIPSLTGKSPLEFIKTIRLQQAAQLLEKSQLTVAEISYKVGFNNPKYFARCFKEVYGILPSMYASQKQAQQPER